MESAAMGRETDNEAVSTPSVNLPKGFVLFASAPPDDLSIQRGKEFLERHGLTKAEIVFRRNDTCVYITTRKEVSIGQ